MEFSDKILQEIENDQKALLEELSLYKEDLNQPPMMGKPTDVNNGEQLSKKQAILNKSNALLKKIKSHIDDDEYLLKGFHYHSKTLYTIATKVPFVGKVIAAPLMAITKAAVNNLPPLAKIEQSKILNLYTSFKGDLSAIEAKIDRLEKLKQLNKNQQDELIRLKKMSSELSFNLKRLETNYKLSHAEAEEARIKRQNFMNSSNKKRF